MYTYQTEKYLEKAKKELFAITDEIIATSKIKAVKRGMRFIQINLSEVSVAEAIKTQDLFHRMWLIKPFIKRMKNELKLVQANPSINLYPNVK